MNKAKITSEIRAKIATEKRIDTEIWIDPFGKTHKFKGTLAEAWDSVSLHYEIAHKLYPKIEFPEDYLVNLNWIRIGKVTGISIKNNPTQAQINAIDAYRWDMDLLFKVPKS